MSKRGLECAFRRVYSRQILTDQYWCDSSVNPVVDASELAGRRGGERRIAGHARRCRVRRELRREEAGNGRAGRTSGAAGGSVSRKMGGMRDAIGIDSACHPARHSDSLANQISLGGQEHREKSRAVPPGQVARMPRLPVACLSVREKCDGVAHGLDGGRHANRDVVVCLSGPMRVPGRPTRNFRAKSGYRAALRRIKSAVRIDPDPAPA